LPNDAARVRLFAGREGLNVRTKIVYGGHVPKLSLFSPFQRRLRKTASTAAPVEAVAFHAVERRGGFDTVAESLMMPERAFGTL
jgi:hypothetical protein